MWQGAFCLGMTRKPLPAWLRFNQYHFRGGEDLLKKNGQL